MRSASVTPIRSLRQAPRGLLLSMLLSLLFSGQVQSQVQSQVSGQAGVAQSGAGTTLPALPAIRVKDDRGDTVLFDQPPRRIVSMLPSLTESVCALGECQRLVGVDRYSNYPAQVRKLPTLGGGMDPNIEAIVALRPDVVLIASSARIRERLAALGVKVLSLEPKTHADVRSTLQRLGDMLAIPKARGADALWQNIDDGVTAAAKALPRRIKGTKVYFEVSRALYAAAPSSFIGETLSRLGVDNIVPDKMGPFPKLNPEFVVRANPDIIMVSVGNFAGMRDRAGWSSIKAIQSMQLCIFNAEDADILARAGPRLAEAARLMSACLLSASARAGS